MKRACILLVLLLTPALEPSPSRAEVPYVQDIGREEGSVEGVVFSVERASQAYIFAQGYEKYNILGLRVTVEGWVENRTESAFESLLLVVSARDLFGEALDSCELGMRLPPESKEPFRCVLDVADATKLINITYRITDRAKDKKGRLSD